MDTSLHSTNTLFAQLGLANSPAEINAFIAKHKGIPSSVRLAQASFWSKAQQDFLEQAIAEDADWAEIVDSLDSQLR
ncbi:DUF2789 domain-containing protein [Thalassotalea montiporae]